MFDPKTYQDQCAQLSLGHEKLEEIITMAENTPRRRLNRPIKTVLIAAACVAALTVTAMAAPAAAQLFTTLTITYRSSDTQTDFVVPTLTLEERDGRNILTINDEETDVTDAFARDGQYSFTQDQASITVKPDGWVEISMPGGASSSPITYTFSLSEEVPISSVGSIQVEEIVPPEAEKMATYSVSVDDIGDVVVSDYTPAE